ncbi:MAG: DUF1223 domain-containing protein [Dokdonella sp.]
MSSRNLLILALAATGASPAQADDVCSATSGAQIKPLVELYTSEGCSSCPPADRWLSTQRERKDINLLAFHVDYWDYIGWKDRFASPAYSQRQRERVQAAGADTVYTPQVMVGSDVRTSWQSSSRFDSALASGSGEPGASIKLSVSAQPSGLEVTLGANLTGQQTSPAQIWLAQYVDDQTSEIAAGENRGSVLRHDRVVRKLWGPWPVKLESELHRQPVEIPGGAWGLVAFVQDGQGANLQSLSLPSNSCRDLVK